MLHLLKRNIKGQEKDVKGYGVGVMGCGILDCSGTCLVICAEVCNNKCSQGCGTSCGGMCATLARNS